MFQGVLCSSPPQVDELAETVTVPAGITQRVLLDWLAGEPSLLVFSEGMQSRGAS